MSSQSHSEENYINVTPQLLAILTIERLATYLSRLRTEPSNWWFAIQDFDLALTSQLVATLSGTTQLGALKKGHQTKMLDYLNDRNENKVFPLDKKGNSLSPEIAPFSELLERATDSKFGFIDNSQNPLILTPAQKKDTLKLHKFRNSLAHVQPVDWHVEIAGLPRMSLACIHAIDHLFKYSSQIIHLSASKVTKNQKNLERISKTLQHSF
jgi:hypothetical protein